MIVDDAVRGQSLVDTLRQWVWLRRIAILVLLLLGSGLRVYRYSVQPLRQDELYTAELALRGLGIIWRTSFREHSLPLSNVLFWLGGQLGGVSAVTLRSVSVIEAILALGLYGYYCVQVLGGWTAVCALGLYAIAPLAIQYAQDARPYALPSLLLVLTLLAFERLRQELSLFNWLIYALSAILAAQSQYILLPLIGAQLLALLILDNQRWYVIMGGAATCVAIAASLIIFSAGAAAEVGYWKTAQSSLTLLSTLQVMFAGDNNGSSLLVRVVALSTAAVASAIVLADRRSWPISVPHLLQIVCFMIASFALLPMLGVFVPVYEGRQFQILLPSVFVCISLGLRHLASNRLGGIVVVALLGMMSVSSAMADQSYFQIYHKSTEADAVRMVLARAQPGDVVVVDCPSFAASATLAYYAPKIQYYRCTDEQSGTIHFSVHDRKSDPNTRLIDSMFVHTVNLREVTRQHRIWLFTRDDSMPLLLMLLESQYQAHDQFRRGVNRVILLEQKPV